MPRSPDVDKMSPASPWIVLEDGTVVSKYDDRGNTNVVLNDQFTAPLDFRMSRSVGLSTVAVETAKEDYTLTVVDGTEYAVDEQVAMAAINPNRFYSGRVLSIATNVLTLDTPLNSVFEVGTNALARSLELAVNGSVTPVVFNFPVLIGTYDITRFIWSMECASAPDDSKFGNLAALTNGVVMRKIPAAGTGETINYWNVKSNGEIASLAYDVAYTDKAGGGNHGVRARMSYAGTEKHGVTIRLNSGDELEYLIQDDLTGLVTLRVVVQGHLVE